jgi:AraC-like DNA-binding protein
MARRSKTADSARLWRQEQAPLPDSFGLVSPLVAYMFAELRIGVALRHLPSDWNVIHHETNVTAFETEHGREQLRWPYNERCFEEVERTRALVRGEHAGFNDLFVPVLDASGVCAIVVAGPFLTQRPTSADIAERWVALTGSRPRLSDPSFAQYVSATLATLTLEGPLGAMFERLLSCFAALSGGHGSARALAAEAKTLQRRLAPARAAERMWEAVHSMVDERTSRSWGALDQAQSRWEAGLGRAPGPLAVGLLVDRAQETDPIDGLVRRDAFQRAAATFARETGGLACGRVGDHGVVLLSDETGSAMHVREHLSDRVAGVQTIARRFGFRLHLGIGQPQDEVDLPKRYLVALAAAERALSQGVPVIHGEPRPEHSAGHVRRVRRQLTGSLGDGQTLSARFEHYTQTVLEHCRYRLEPVHAKLEAGLERLTEPLLASGSLDERSFDEMSSSLERSAAEETTVTALVTRYRQVVSDIEAAVATPTLARHGRSMRRALAFMREHAGEPLGLTSVARVAGFAPDHFSKLFKRTEGTTFENYLLGLRIEHAKQMLGSTSLHVEGVSGLCGFKNRIHFHRAFKQAVGVTPVDYRRLRHRASGVQTVAESKPRQRRGG